MKIRSCRLAQRRFEAAMLAGCALATLGRPASAQTNPLITGKSITLPPVGTTANVGSLPMNLILSPNGQYALSTNMGFRQSLWTLNTATGAGTYQLKFDNRMYDPTQTVTNGLYYGLAFDRNGLLYAAQGQNNTVAVLSLDSAGTLTQIATITGKTFSALGVTGIDFPAGVATDARGYLYVTNNDSGTPLVPSSLAIYDIRPGSATLHTELGRTTFTNSHGGTPNFPLAVTALADGSRVYVGSQRDDAIYVFDATDPANPTLSATLSTGAHPIALLLTNRQDRLYVANAHSDTITVLNTADNSIAQTILLRPDGARGLVGVTPNNLALSPDEKTLYVTLGDMNAVAVVDTLRFRLKGYIPTGWYPTGVVVSPDNQRLLVTNAKGTQTRYPNPTYTTQVSNPPPPDFDPTKYDLNYIEGNVETIALPNPSTLTDYTQQVLLNNRITPTTDKPASNPLASIGLQAGKIKHVVYIVKENRTYDQVLGDLPQGNGRADLTIFGSRVTPNQHALAQRFVLLDNFYDCGEASGDGWPWSTQSIANEYVIKNLPYNYSNRGRNYDFEGQDNGYLTGGHPARDIDGHLLSDLFPNGLPPIPDVAEAPANHIWDLALRAGLTFRNYGFFYSFGVTVPQMMGPPITIIPDNYPASSGLQPAGRIQPASMGTVMAGNSDFDFRRYDNDYPDSDAPDTYFQQTGDPNCLYALTQYGKFHMPSRYAEWKREFDLMLTTDPTGDSIPNFMTVRFHHDHTQGFSPGKHTPASEVADNDYAVGQLVDAISKSPIWNSTAIFVIEDDAQDGPDHVDAHRSPCYVISPWIKQSTVDHTFYNTDSVLKTIELLLGLPAMSQYDAIADPIDPIMTWDKAPNNSAPYSAILPPSEVICEKVALNLSPKDPLYRLAKLSEKMDFTRPDSAPARLLNEILWQSRKGVRSKMPAPVHSLIVRQAKQKPSGVKEAGKKATPVETSSRKPHDDD